MSGTDIAIYWIEYVLRHGGTKHLHLGAKNLPFYKSYFLDAFAIIAFVVVFFVYISYLTIRKCFRLLLGKKELKSKTH